MKIIKDINYYFKVTPFPVSPRGEKLRKSLAPWGKVGMGVIIIK